jgi:hypothetical protein
MTLKAQIVRAKIDKWNCKEASAQKRENSAE